MRGEMFNHPDVGQSRGTATDAPPEISKGECPVHLSGQALKPGIEFKLLQGKGNSLRSHLLFIV